MKRILSIVVLASIFFVSCEGDPGPQGPPGEDGLDGLGYTYEATVDLEYVSDFNHYSQIIDIPETVDTPEPESDAVFVYRLEVLDGGTDAWSLLPQNFFLEEGTIQYVYNHTVSDVEIILDGNFDLSGLDSGFTDGQTFRIVVIPSATFAENSSIDVSNYEAMKKTFNINESDIIKVE